MTAAVLALILTASFPVDTPRLDGWQVVSSIQSGELDSVGIQWSAKF
jgi:hypothetical protein